jgi:hypothetical protein
MDILLILLLDIGKIMNGYNMATYNNPKPQGWDHTDFLVCTFSLRTY